MSHAAALYFKAIEALDTTQAGIGRMLGVSRRTAQRWASTGLPGYHVADVLRLLHERDPAAAAALAASAGTTLEAQGIAPPPAPPSPPEGLVDAVVCAAADALRLLPCEVRPGLLSAFTRARELGFTLESVEGELRKTLPPSITPAPAPAPASASAPAPAPARRRK